MTRTKLIRPRIGLILTGAVLSVSLAACGGGGGDGGGELPIEDDPVPEIVTEVETEVETEVVPEVETELVSEVEPTAQDNFVFQFDQAFIDGSNEDFLNFINTTVGGAVAPLNRIDNVFLNTTIPVIYAACGEANAFYAPTERLIVLCDELGELAFNYFLSFLDDSDESTTFALEQATNTLVFVMYHEMGHALDDIRDLGVGGNFESVADAIGTVLSVQTGQPLAAIDGGFFFLSSTGGSFADEHGAGEDRAGDVLCWVVGSSSLVSAAFPDLAAQFTNVGRDCVGEYANQFQFVEQLIPNLRNIPPVASTRSRPTQAELDHYAEMDKEMADLIRE